MTLTCSVFGLLLLLPSPTVCLTLNEWSSPPNALLWAWFPDFWCLIIFHLLLSIVFVWSLCLVIVINISVSRIPFKNETRHLKRLLSIKNSKRHQQIGSLAKPVAGNTAAAAERGLRRCHRAAVTLPQAHQWAVTSVCQNTECLPRPTAYFNRVYRNCMSASERFKISLLKECIQPWNE